MPSLAATRLYGAAAGVLNISVCREPPVRGVLSRRTGMLCSLAGNTQAGCRRSWRRNICQLGGLFKMERAHRRRALWAKSGGRYCAYRRYRSKSGSPRRSAQPLLSRRYSRCRHDTRLSIPQPVALRAYQRPPGVIYASASPSTSRMRCRSAPIYAGHVGFAARQGAHISRERAAPKPGHPAPRGRRSSCGCRRHKLAPSGATILAGLCERLYRKYERMIANNERSMGCCGRLPRRFTSDSSS